MRVRVENDLEEWSKRITLRIHDTLTPREYTDVVLRQNPDSPLVVFYEAELERDLPVSALSAESRDHLV